MSTGLPSVGVVVPTRDRPELLARTIRSVLAQDYEGVVELVVVYDGTEPDRSLVAEGHRPVSVMQNQRAQGLSGTRNTGILSLSTDLVAFCDDDDWWAPEKLRLQVDAMQDDDIMATCSITVDFEGSRTSRTAGKALVERSDLLRSRMSMMHSSTFVFRRSALLGELGLIAEDAPGSQNEDWDILLRASAIRPIRHVDRPAVSVQWGRTSFYSRRWESRNESLLWMLDRNPDITGSRTGYARVLGQLAFGEASLGHRRAAWRRAWQATRVKPTEWRAPLAALVAVVPASSEVVLGLLNRVGRGV
ncbi:glycosyltransferase family 2 protein [Isoptericola jiangsuensis]|uniref:glycosyltransferase family 2 protein n=1 Tax=Isoptericola jiangsuensis TaxID=548579 RepID=UPI003AAB2129